MTEHEESIDQAKDTRVIHCPQRLCAHFSNSFSIATYNDGYPFSLWPCTRSKSFTDDDRVGATAENGKPCPCFKEAGLR